jgi:hypothetical protein
MTASQLSLEADNGKSGQSQQNGKEISLERETTRGAIYISTLAAQWILHDINLEASALYFRRWDLST